MTTWDDVRPIALGSPVATKPALRLPYRPQLPMRTQRLELRGFTAADFDALLPYHGDQDVVRYVPFEPRTPESMAVALERKLAGTALKADGDHLDLAVTLAGGGPLVGDLVLMLRSVEHAMVEVGYIFDPGHAGCGYATEAVSAMLDLAFLSLGAHRAAARVDSRNSRSLALCERLGMRREAHLVDSEWFKGEWSSEIDYAMLDREWRQRRPHR